MIKYNIGIDPSLNSTGLCILTYDDDNIIDKYFAIIKTSKLSKKEKIANENYSFFDYYIVDIYNLKDYEEDNHLHEVAKTSNFISVLEKICEVITDYIQSKEVNINIVQEGISYGSSLKTRSVFDLAGLNYMLRYKLRQYLKDFTSSTYWIIPPTEIKKFATGKGNSKKDVLIEEFKKKFPEFDLPKIDDVVDAYFMASYCNKL